ncbi:MAG: sugar phosphate isomerase/epimerase [Prolixibacteraceae bacterium]|nr:sugar phosphate isomerase/epimerase [Prolixibacteraceae bacterium]
MQFGVTASPFSARWNLPTLIEKMSETGISGVELNVEDDCGIHRGLDKKERLEIRKILKCSAIDVVGLNTDEYLDYTSPDKLRYTIEKIVEYAKLSSDVGGRSIGINQGRFQHHIPKSRTVYQIGRTLNQIARIASAYNQQIRLIIDGHGDGNMETVKDIMDVADHPNATVSWNSSLADLKGNGLEDNFKLLQSRLGNVVYVQDMNDPAYPYKDLIRLLADSNYRGWVIYKAQIDTPEKSGNLAEQRKIFERLLGETIFS